MVAEGKRCLADQSDPASDIAPTVIAHDQVNVNAASLFDAKGLGGRLTIVYATVRRHGHAVDVLQEDAGVSPGFPRRVIQADIAHDGVIRPVV